MTAANQAAWLDEKGSPLNIRDAPTGKVGDNEVLIKNHAIAINPADWKMQDFGLFVQSYPTILGCDVAGEVVEVGSNVQRFKAGDRVMAQATVLASGDAKHGAFQKYTVAPATATGRIPESMSFEQGVVLPLAISTAASGLYQAQSEGFIGLPYPKIGGQAESHGKVVVIYGASGSVGAITTRMAAASGARIIALASEKNFDFVRSNGASQVFDYKDPEVVDKVVKAVQTLGVENFAGVYDAISVEDQSYHITLPIVEKLGGGSVAIVSMPPKSTPAGVKIGGVFGMGEVADPVWLDYVEPALASGALKPVPEPLVIGNGLEHIQAGIRKSKEGVSARKLVVTL